MEELKIKIEKIAKNDDSEIDTKINNTKKELRHVKTNIDNIIFCRLQKEIKKNEQIILNLNIDNSNEIAMMRTLTELNIVPISFKSNEINHNENITPNMKYLYFLLSKMKSKNISPQLEPYEFWSTLLKFKGLKESN